MKPNYQHRHAMNKPTRDLDREAGKVENTNRNFLNFSSEYQLICGFPGNQWKLSRSFRCLMESYGFHEMCWKLGVPVNFRGNHGTKNFQSLCRCFENWANWTDGFPSVKKNTKEKTRIFCFPYILEEWILSVCEIFLIKPSASISATIFFSHWTQRASPQHRQFWWVFRHFLYQTVPLWHTDYGSWGGGGKLIEKL